MIKNKKVIICAALTGSITSKANNNNLPITEDEIVNEAINAFSAGAGIIHIHVRDSYGNPSLSYEKYDSVIKRIRQKCDPIICVSTSNYGIDIEDEERYRLFDLDAEMFSLSFGSLQRPNGMICNSTSFIENCFSIATEKNKKLEIEIFNQEMFENFLQFSKKQSLESPYVQLVFGSQGGMDSSFCTIASMLESIPQNWRISAAGVGKMQLPVNMMSMFYGAVTIRTGLEDNVCYSYGVKAKSNTQLVERLISMIQLAGYEVATHEEMRTLLL